MAALRSTLFALLFYPGTLLYVLAILTAVPFGERAVRRFVHAWAKFHYWLVQHILGIRFEWEGKIPDGPYLIAVKHQACVDRWAESQARWMAKRGVLKHRDGRLGQIMKACKLTGASENIAWNYRSGTKAVRAWKNSPGHARNMRAPAMRYIGVGAVKDDDGQWWVAQVFGTRK